MLQIVRNDKLYFKWILAISIFIPAAVAVLIYLPSPVKIEKGSFDVSFLPAVNGAINSLVSILLIVGIILVKQRKLEAHRIAMITSFFLSALFLISYIVYHAVVDQEKRYDGEGAIRAIYFFILISHIVLSAAIVPMVLVTMYRSMTGQLEAHRKIAKITFPIWLYVSVTGVIVYFMLHFKL